MGHLHDNVFLLLRPEFMSFFPFIFKLGSPSEVFFYQLFWTQNCPEGIGSKGTHGSHARCHPYPIPQPVKVENTTSVYDPYSFWIVMLVFLHPTRTNQWKCCETGPMVSHPYLRRQESLTIWRSHLLQRQHFLLSYLKTLSVGLAGVWTRDLCLADQLS